jgi:hypothetical protein
MKLMPSGRRLVGLGHKPSKLAIPGSNPGDRTIFTTKNAQVSLILRNMAVRPLPYDVSRTLRNCCGARSLFLDKGNSELT